VPFSDAELARADAVVIITDHSSIDYQRVVDLAPLVVDTRNATAGLVRTGSGKARDKTPNVAIA
jgi:UDP-N-acetyl-D-glucosamine dehydrogenase